MDRGADGQGCPKWGNSRGPSKCRVVCEQGYHVAGGGDHVAFVCKAVAGSEWQGSYQGNITCKPNAHVPYTCQCPNGVAATGTACKAQDTTACSACDSGYYLRPVPTPGRKGGRPQKPKETVKAGRVSAKEQN